MKIPSAFVLRSRSLFCEDGDDLARYVPAYDGTVVALSPENGSVRLSRTVAYAEAAHRWFSLHTNVGASSFLSEFFTTFYFIDIASQASEDVAKRSYRRNVFYRSNEATKDLFESYEITDETFSAICAYCALRISENKSAIESLEQTLGENYDSDICASYDRVKALVEKTHNKDKMRFWSNLFVDSAAVSWDEGEASCDERFQVLLSLAEKGSEIGLTGKNLRQYWLSGANSCGIKIASAYFIRPPKTFHAAVPMISEIINRVGIDEEFSQDMYEFFARSALLRNRDSERWPHFSATVPFNAKKEQSSTVHVCYQNGKWVYQFKRHSKLAPPKSMWKAWALLTRFTIIRNAILNNVVECPSTIIKGDRCPPSDDPHCTYAKMRKTMFS